MDLNEARAHYNGLREQANQAGTRDIANVYTKVLEGLNNADTIEEAKQNLTNYQQNAITGVKRYLNEAINNLD